MKWIESERIFGSSWNLVFWYFFSNSYLYNLTYGFTASNLDVNLPTRTFSLAARAFSILTRGFELTTRRFELVTCGFELLTRRFELIACRFELVTGISSLATRVLLFHCWSWNKLPRGVVVITTAQLYSSKPELRLCSSSWWGPLTRVPVGKTSRLNIFRGQQYHKSNSIGLTCMIELFARMLRKATIFAKVSFTDVWRGPKYAGILKKSQKRVSGLVKVYFPTDRLCFSKLSPDDYSISVVYFKEFYHKLLVLKTLLDQQQFILKAIKIGAFNLLIGYG